MAVASQDDVKVHAAGFLTDKKIAFDRIVRVDVDAILFISVIGNAMTCWLEYDELHNKVEHQVAAGFPSERE